MHKSKHIEQQVMSARLPILFLLTVKYFQFDVAMG